MSAGVRFVPFTDVDFHAWLLQAIPAFALTNVEDGRWTLAESIEKSKEAHALLLPQGLQTPDQFFMHLQDADSRLNIGALWWAESDQAGQRQAYVYNIEIEDHARRRGYARAAFHELERVAREHGVHHLYDELGFEPTSMTLRKIL
jgi:ribosomal protein S18 acetylase RimI-like enzyme